MNAGRNGSRQAVGSKDWDQILLLAALTLVGVGIVMIASASLHLGERFDQPFHFVGRQLLALCLGGAGALALTRVPSAWWSRASTPLYFFGLLTLAVLLIPGVGKEVNGAVRWMPIGPFNLQTSEFMKLFLILYLAGYLVRRRLEVAHSVWAFIRPLSLLLLAACLLIWQPDFGTTVILLAIALGMLFLGGAPLWQFAVLVLSAVAALASLVLVSGERLERVTTFLNPWADPLDSGYQLTQALIAFGRGEWAGVGLGNGIQKQFYLPEAHTDFLMAVIGEEFGLVGTLTVIGLFSLVIYRAFKIGATAEARNARFGAYVAYGLGLWIGMQAFINIGVNVGALPTKGLTLPFISYGSNSLIACVLALGMLERIHYENSHADDAGEGPWLSA